MSVKTILYDEGTMGVVTVDAVVVVVEVAAAVADDDDDAAAGDCDIEAGLASVALPAASMTIISTLKRTLRAKNLSGERYSQRNKLGLLMLCMRSWVWSNWTTNC